MCDCEKSTCGTAGLLAALLPALKRAHGHAKQRGELRLRKTRTFARLDGVRKDNLSLSSFHLPHGLKQLGCKVPPGLISPKLSISERFSFQGHGEPPLA